MMKKYFCILTAMMLACCSLVSLASCGGGDHDYDDDNTNPPSAGVKPASAELTTYAWFSQDIVDLANIDVSYVDADGSTRKAEVGKTIETVSVRGQNYNVYPVKVSVTATRFPVKLDMRIRYTAKQGVNAQPDKLFNFTFIGQEEAHVTYSNGERSGNKNPDMEFESRSYRGDLLDMAIRYLNDECDEVEVEVENSGQIDF